MVGAAAVQLNTTYEYVIEALESSISRPNYLYGISGGNCFFFWTDEYGFAKKWETHEDAHNWAMTHHLYCGIRIREYANQSKIKRRV
jgi:hypothetical protein